MYWCQKLVHHLCSFYMSQPYYEFDLVPVVTIAPSLEDRSPLLHFLPPSSFPNNINNNYKGKALKIKVKQIKIKI